MSMIQHQKHSSLTFFTNGRQRLLYRAFYNVKDTHFILYQYSNVENRYA